MNKSTKTIELSQEKFDSLISEVELYKNKLTQTNTAYNQLLYNFKQLQRNQFGRKSERFIDDENNSQADLFAALEDDDLAIDEEKDGDKNNKNQESNVIDIAAYGVLPG